MHFGDVGVSSTAIKMDLTEMGITVALQKGTDAKKNQRVQVLYLI
jgi:hypothetical protein